MGNGSGWETCHGLADGHLGLLFCPNRVSLVISSCPAISCLIRETGVAAHRAHIGGRSSWRCTLLNHRCLLPSKSRLPSPFPASHLPSLHLLARSPHGGSCQSDPSPPQLGVTGRPPVLQTPPTAMSHLLFHGILKNSPTSDGSSPPHHFAPNFSCSKPS